MVRVVGDEPFGRHNHRRQAAFHVCRATAAEHALFVDDRIERVELPGLHRTGRHHVGVPGEAQHRAVMLAMAGPEVIHILDTHRFERKARVAQALHHQFLAIGIHRRHGRTADQVAGELQGRREVGVGRHESSGNIV
nr:hypothetical protein GCM10020185_16900 [Pseudomonas brassicacearum subsp. brassicacearum]